MKYILSLLVLAGCATRQIEVECIHLQTAQNRTILYCGKMVRCEAVQNSAGFLKVCELKLPKRKSIITVESDTIRQ